MGPPANNWIKRAIATGSISGPVAFLWSHVILPWAVPIMTPFMVGWIAKAQGYPWAETIVFGLVAFAATAHGLLRFDEWRARRRVRDRLIFTNVTVRRDLTDTNKAVRVIQMGALLKNDATFPISYLVKRIYSTADATTPTRGTMDSWGGIIQGGQEGSFFDRPIDLKTPKDSMGGSFEIELLYGRAGAERYSMRRKLNVSLRLDPRTGQLHCPWADSPTS